MGRSDAPIQPDIQLMGLGIQVNYLKKHALVGRPDDPLQPDIQLMGLGIQVKISEEPRTSLGRPDAPFQPDIQLMSLGIQVKVSEETHPRGLTRCSSSARYSAHGPWHPGKSI